MCALLSCSSFHTRECIIQMQHGEPWNQIPLPPCGWHHGISCWQISALSAGVGFIYHTCSSSFCVDKNESEFWKNEPEVCSKMHQNLLNSALEMCSRNAPEMCSKMHQLVGMLFSFFKQGWMARRFIFAITKKKKEKKCCNYPPPPPPPPSYPNKPNQQQKTHTPKNGKERRARWHCKGFCREQNIKEAGCHWYQFTWDIKLSSKIKWGKRGRGKKLHCTTSHHVTSWWPLNCWGTLEWESS